MHIDKSLKSFSKWTSGRRLNVSGSSSGTLSPGVVTAVFALFNLIGILRHELWRDELQAWMLTRDSGSLLEVFQHLRNEGHPSLWHLCLYGLNQWSHNPLLMQLFHSAIAIATVYIIQRFSPFNLTQKILLTFSYFLAYEYAIISRSYGLGAFFLFAFCAAFVQSRSLFSLALLLVFLANTNAFGVLISFALALLLLFRWWDERREKQARRNFFGVLLILGSGWFVSLAQITRPIWEPLLAKHVGRLGFMPLVETVATAVIPEDVVMTFPVKVVYSFVQIWKAYVPIPALGEPEFWNTNLLLDSSFSRFSLSDFSFSRLEGLPIGLALGLLMSAAIVAWTVVTLRRSPRLITVYLLGTAFILLFCIQFFWWGSLRHQGYLWLLFVACLWLGKANVFGQEQTARVSLSSVSELSSQRLPSVRLGLFTLLLVLQSFAGLFLYSQDLLYSFSSSRQTAHYIRHNQLETLTLVGVRDRETSVLSGYLNKPLFYPERDQFGSFWDIYNKPLEAAELARRIEQLADQDPEDLLLVLSYPLEPSLEQELKQVAVTPLADFQSKLIDSESFYLYRLQDRT